MQLPHHSTGFNLRTVWQPKSNVLWRHCLLRSRRVLCTLFVIGCVGQPADSSLSATSTSVFGTARFVLSCSLYLVQGARGALALLRRGYLSALGPRQNGSNYAGATVVLFRKTSLANCVANKTRAPCRQCCLMDRHVTPRHRRPCSACRQLPNALRCGRIMSRHFTY